LTSSSTAARSGRSARAQQGGGREPDFITLIRGWGGVTLAYRKRLQDAPATA
jgi:hypothetical protein